MDELVDGPAEPVDRQARAQAPAPDDGPGVLARFGQGVVRGIALVAIGLFVAFGVANMHFVEFSWLFGRTELQEIGGERVAGGVPLILLLFGAFLLGLVVGWALTALRARARRRAARR